MNESYVKDNTAYAEARKKDEIHPDDGYELNTQKMQTNATPFLDRNADVAIGLDKDGDGKPDIFTSDMNDGFSLKPKFIPKVNEDTVLKTFTSTLEPEVNQTDENFVKTKNNGYLA